MAITGHTDYKDNNDNDGTRHAGQMERHSPNPAAEGLPSCSGLSSLW